MGGSIRILMYHYVRPEGEKFSNNHKILDLGRFKKQIEILTKKYVFIDGRRSFESEIENQHSESKLVWLTFDDGYSDHYKYVFPELLERGIRGSFFIPTEAIFDKIGRAHV